MGKYHDLEKERKIREQFGIKAIFQSRAITDFWKTPNCSTCSRIPFISKDNIADIYMCNNIFDIKLIC